MTKEQFLKSSRGKQWGYLFVRHPLTILFGYFFMFIYGMCINPFLNEPRKHWDCFLALVVHVGVGIGFFFWDGWQAVIMAQTIPHFIAFAIGTYLFYAQHNFPDVSFSDKAGWTYEKAALESSSFMKTNSIMAWFTANIGYHHIHHLNARIPFYRLPEVLRDHPALREVGRLNLWDSLACVRLALWDEDRQRMVSFRDARALRTPG